MVSRSGAHTGGTAVVELLDRGDESSTLDERMAAARAGRGAFVTVEGPAGIGKTSLLEDTRARAVAAGLTVLAARGSALEADLPFGVVRQLVEPRLRSAGEAERARLFAGAAARCRPLLLGEADTNAGAADAGVTLVHSLYWLLATLADDAPLLVTIDDAHWADSRSLDFVAFLTSRLLDLAVLVVLATRPPQPGSHPVLLDSRTPAACLTPAPLSHESVSTFVAAHLPGAPDPAFVAACREATGGNPFYLRELARQLAAETVAPTAEAAPDVGGFGPRGVARSVFARIDGVSPAALAFSRALAVLGDDAELHHVGSLAGLSRGDAAAAASALTRADVLAAARTLRFAHPIVGASIYADLPAAERSELHAAAARLLAAGAADPGRVARHLSETGPIGEAWAVDALWAAATAATAAGAPATAAGHLRRALLEPVGDRRIELLRTLGAAEFVAGEPAAVAHLEEALAAAEGPAERALAARELTNPMLVSGRVGEALDTLEASAAALGPEHAGLALELQAARSGLALIQGAGAAAVMEPLRRFASAPGESSAERHLLAHLAYWRAGTGAGRDEAAELADRALRCGLLGDTSAASPAFAYAVFVLIAADRFERADEFLVAALDDARRRASTAAFVVASSLRSLSAYRQGALDTAEAEARAAVLGARENGWEEGFPVATAFLADALVDRGRLDEARVVLAADTDARTDRPLVEQLLVARGRLALASGDLRAGIDHIRAAGELSERGGSVGTAGTPTFRTYVAPALAALGDRDEAQRLAGEELALARSWGAPRGIGMALYAAALADEGEPRIALLREAVETLSQTPARLEQARSLLALGEALRRAGGPAEARDPLREAAQLAHAAGAAGLADRAEAELATTGARRIARGLLSGSDSLTPSERRIALMAAAGDSNRAIAQQLFLTKKTVETHLSHVYGKLGIAGRAELAAALDEPARSE